MNGLEVQQLGRRELEGFGELVQRVDLSRWRILEAFQPLDVAVGQVSPLG